MPTDVTTTQFDIALNLLNYVHCPSSLIHDIGYKIAPVLSTNNTNFVFDAGNGFEHFRQRLALEMATDLVSAVVYHGEGYVGAALEAVDVFEKGMEQDRSVWQIGLGTYLTYDQAVDQHKIDFGLMFIRGVYETVVNGVMLPAHLFDAVMTKVETGHVGELDFTELAYRAFADEARLGLLVYPFAKGALSLKVARVASTTALVRPASMSTALTPSVDVIPFAKGVELLVPKPSPSATFSHPVPKSVSRYSPPRSPAPLVIESDLPNGLRRVVSGRVVVGEGSTAKFFELLIPGVLREELPVRVATRVLSEVDAAVAELLGPQDAPQLPAVVARVPTRIANSATAGMGVSRYTPTDVVGTSLWGKVNPATDVIEVDPMTWSARQLTGQGESWLAGVVGVLGTLVKNGPSGLGDTDGVALQPAITEGVLGVTPVTEPQIEMTAAARARGAVRSRRSEKLGPVIAALERLAVLVEDKQDPLGSEFLVQGLAVLRRLDACLRRGLHPSTAGEAQRLARSLLVVLPHVVRLSLDQFTDGGKDPALAVERLRTMVYGRIRAGAKGARPVRCVNITLDLTTLNKLNTTAGTRIGDALYVILNSFVTSQMSVDEFLAQQDLVGTLMRPAGQGWVTMINRTVFSVQVEQLDRVELFLQNAPQLLEGVLRTLITERSRLTALRSPPRAEQERLAFVRSLSDGFEIEGDAIVFRGTNEGNGSSTISLSELPVNLAAGYAEFGGGTEDKKQPPRSRVVVGGIIDGVRTWALNRAEAAFTALRGDGEKVSGLVGQGDQRSPSSATRLPWRLGRLVSDQEVVDGLVRVGRRTEDISYGSENRDRAFRVVTRTDLEEILVVVAEQFLDGKRSSVTGKTEAVELGLAWLAALDREGASLSNPIVSEMVYAFQRAFTQPVTDARLRAFYQDELNGFVDPTRYLRELSDTQHPSSLTPRLTRLLSQLLVSQDVISGPLTDTQSRDLEWVLTQLQVQLPRLEDATHHPRDRMTQSWPYFPATAVSTTNDYYGHLRSVPVDERGAYIVTTELAHGRALNLKDPAQRDDLIDRNMLLLRLVGFITALRIYGPSPGGSGFLYQGQNLPRDVATGYVRGDEAVFVFPKHDRNGRLVSPARITEVMRAVVGEMFPNEVHYLGKITVNDATERLSLWRLSAQTAATGEAHLTIATSRNVNGGPLLAGAWIYVNGNGNGNGGMATPYQVPEGITPREFLPVMGLVGVRTVALEIPLSDLTAERIEQAGSAGMEADNTLQATAKERGLDPTAGVFMLQPDGSLVQVLPEELME